MSRVVEFGGEVGRTRRVRANVERDEAGGAPPPPEGLVRDHPEQPGAQGALVADRAATLEGGQEGLDHGILGFRAIAQDQVRDRLELAAVRLEQLSQGLGPSPAQRFDGHRPSIARTIMTAVREVDARAGRFGLVDMAPSNEWRPSTS